MFSGLFKPKDTRTPEEKYADMKKDIRANVRAIDRQIRKLERELKKSEDDIKKCAKNGSSVAVLRAKCKSRVMLQNGITHLQGVRTNVESLLTNIILQKAQILQMDAMKKGAISMRLINEGMDAAGMRQVVADFQKEMMRNEINTGIIDDAFAEPDAEDVDAEVDKALFEVAGVKMSDLVAAGTGGVKIGEQQAQQVRSAGLPDIPNSIVCWKQNKRSKCSEHTVWRRTDEQRDDILRRGFRRFPWKPRVEEWKNTNHIGRIRICKAQKHTFFSTHFNVLDVFQLRCIYHREMYLSVFDRYPLDFLNRRHITNIDAVGKPCDQYNATLLDLTKAKIRFGCRCRQLLSSVGNRHSQHQLAQKRNLIP